MRCGCNSACLSILSIRRGSWGWSSEVQHSKTPVCDDQSGLNGRRSSLGSGCHHGRNNGGRLYHGHSRSGRSRSERVGVCQSMYMEAFCVREERFGCSHTQENEVKRGNIENYFLFSLSSLSKSCVQFYLTLWLIICHTQLYCGTVLHLCHSCGK